MGENKTLEQIKADVMDLLNQIVLLTNGIKAGPTMENYNYQEVLITSTTLNDFSEEELVDKGIDVTKLPALTELDNQVYLYAVGKYARRVVDGDADSAAHNETQYYNSNC